MPAALYMPVCGSPTFNQPLHRIQLKAWDSHRQKKISLDSRKDYDFFLLFVEQYIQKREAQTGCSA